SMQMRWYTGNADHLGHTFTNFDLPNVTKVEFKAKNTAGINVIASYSTDEGITWVGDQTFVLSTSTEDFTYNISATGEYENVRIKFQLTFDVPPSGTSRLYIDEVVVYGISEIPTEPVLMSSETQITDLGYMEGETSPSQVFSLSGLNLTPSNGNIIVTSPVNFQISIDDVSFDSSLNIAYFGSELASTDIYVRLSEGLLIGTYNGDVTISGGGANTILNVEGAVTEFVNICGEEDFENIPTANSSSYSTRTWVGSNGVEWTVNDSRSDQTISGKAITLRVSTLTTTSPVNGGVGTISFDYKRSFTGNSTLKVFVNGTQYGGDIVVTDETPTNFSTEVNLGGDITIELVNTGQRTTIDNLSWTCYTSNTSILSVAPATITGLNYGLGNGPSTAQSF